MVVPCVTVAVTSSLPFWVMSKEAAGATEINSSPAISPVQVTLYAPDFVSPERVIFLGMVTVKVEPTSA